MEKRVFCQLNGNRKVIGVLRGYDVGYELPTLACLRDHYYDGGFEL